MINADWIIDLGPEGGDGGGEIVAAGTPEDVCAVKRSYTGQFLKPVLARGSAGSRASASRLRSSQMNLFDDIPDDPELAFLQLRSARTGSLFFASPRRGEVERAISAFMRVFDALWRARVRGSGRCAVARSVPPHPPRTGKGKCTRRQEKTRCPSARFVGARFKMTEMNRAI
jgi:hypothetical protein